MIIRLLKFRTTMALWGVCDVHVNVLYLAMYERCENFSVRCVDINL